MELQRLKAEWTQECEVATKQHNEQISQILKEVEALKEQSLLKQKAQDPEPGDKLSGLKTSAFNFIPGTVNTKRGGATNLQEETILWSKYDEPPPIPPRKVKTKHIHFTSTPRHSVQPNLIDLDDEACTTIHTGNPFVNYPSNPLVQLEVPLGNPPIPASGNTEATTILGNTMTAVASEFKKMREPKLAKLKGGTTANASLFFTSWVKDARAVIVERSMSNYESVQLVKDYTEGKARAQVEFYLASTPSPMFEGLIQDLAKSFQSGEDEATIKRDFYSRMQLNKESVDDFAEVQLLPRKILNVDPSFQSLLNKSLCQQLVNGLKDASHGISARQILKQQPDIPFVAFRSDLANILGCRTRAVGAKGALSSVVTSESPETPVPAKRCRTQEDESSIATQLSMCIKDNQELHRKLDAFDRSKMVEAVTHAVASDYQKGYQKSNPFVKSTNPFQATNTNQSQSSQFSRPYLGQPREPQLTPGADGNLNPALSCKYCKDAGHDVGNCAKVKRKEALKAAAATQSAPKPKVN